MSSRIVNVFAAQAGSYAILIHKEQGGLILPVVAWIAREGIDVFGEPSIDLTPMVSDSTEADTDEPTEITNWINDWKWKTFAPGESAYRWIELFEQEYYKIPSWDVSNWWPSKSPLFATADETLWTEDFIPPDTTEDT